MPHITFANMACGWRRRRRPPEPAGPHRLRPPSDGRPAPGTQGLPTLPDRGARRVRAGARYAAPARQVARHRVPHGRGRPAAGRAGAEHLIELDPELILMVMARTRYDAEARRTGARVAARGLRRPSLRRRRAARHPQALDGRPGQILSGPPISCGVSAPLRARRSPERSTADPATPPPRVPKGPRPTG